MSNIDYEQRYRRAVQIALDAGLSKGTVEPPLLKIVRSWGKQIKPPVYGGFVEVFWHYTITFGILFALIMFFVFWQNGNTPIIEAILATGFAGMGFGASVSGYFLWVARRAKLPDWDAL